MLIYMFLYIQCNCMNVSIYEFKTCELNLTISEDDDEKRRKSQCGQNIYAKVFI